jgi:hypothetical protein
MNSHNETLLRDDLRSIAGSQPFTPDLGAIERRARQLRRRGTTARGMAGLSVVATVTAAALTVGVAQSGPGGSTSGVLKSASAGRSGHGLSSAQALLYKLASASAAAPALEGRYAILSEIDTETGEPGESKRTSVIDTQTGASTTYQAAYPADGQAPGSDYTSEPSTLTEGADPTSTEAWYAALSTDPTALRTQLLTIAKQQAVQAQDQMQQQAAKAGKVMPTQVPLQPTLSDDDYVYQEADTLLWSPLVQPTLRSALYKVLAGTNEFSVNSGAVDPAGRPAIAMVRHYNGVPEVDTTYEDPSTGAVLAQVWSENGDVITAVYQPVTSADTVPADPYMG